MRKIAVAASVTAAALELNIAQEVLSAVRRVSKWGQKATDLTPEQRALLDQYITVSTSMQHLLNQKHTERKNPTTSAPKAELQPPAAPVVPPSDDNTLVDK